MNNNEQCIDHEVRIRLLEKIAEKIDERFNKMDDKIDKNFHTMLSMQVGTLVALIAMFGGLLLTKFMS